jgi:hypothetical protein
MAKVIFYHASTVERRSYRAGQSAEVGDELAELLASQGVARFADGRKVERSMVDAEGRSVRAFERDGGIERATIDRGGRND